MCSGSSPYDMRDPIRVHLLVWALVIASALPLLALAVRLRPTAGELDVRAFGNSLGFACLGAAVAVTLGASAAFLAGTSEFPLRRLLTAALALPVAAPPAFWWIGWSHLPGPLRSAHGLVPAAVAAGWALSPVPFLLTLAAVREIPGAAYDAARLALPPRGRVARILVPLARSGMAAGFLLAVILLLGESEVPFLFGFRTTTTEIVTQFARSFDAAAIAPLVAPLLLAVLALGIAAGRPLLAALLAAPRGRTGPARRPLPIASLALLLLASPSLLALVGYVGSAGSPRFDERLRTLLHGTAFPSVAEPVASAWLALLFGGGAAFLLRRSRGQRSLLTVGLLLFCVPAAIWSIGWIELGQVLGGRSVPLAVAHVSRLWGLAALGLAAARSRLPASLEQAADLVPVSPARRALRLVLPPLAPSLSATAVLVAALVFSDRDVASLLLPPGGERLMLDLYLLAANAPAAAVGTLAVAVLLAGLLTAIFAVLGPWAVLRWHV